MVAATIALRAVEPDPFTATVAYRSSSVSRARWLPTRRARTFTARTLDEIDDRDLRRAARGLRVAPELMNNARHQPTACASTCRPPA